MDNPKPLPSEWRKRLRHVWPKLDEAVSGARRRREDSTEQLANQKIDVPSCGWIDRVSDWACPRRGLGDFSRFVLFRFQRIQEIGGNTFLLPKGLKNVRKFPTKAWVSSISEQNSEFGSVVADLIRRFDAQLGHNHPPLEKDLETLRNLVAQDSFWTALAAAANSVMKQRGQLGFRELDPKELRHQRFAGSTAVEDFIGYLNCGGVPAWQASHPDDLSDLGARSPESGLFLHNVPFFESPERSAQLDSLVSHCTSPPGTSFRVSCLYSRTEPHGLVAACNELIIRYAKTCIKARLTRMPVVYVPVGLDMQAPRVSRREVIRDLHRKLCVDRSVGDASGPKVPSLAEYATGEQIDTAVGAIRNALADCPTLLIFGVHHVSSDEELRAIEEEILDSPLPYALDRTMPEAGGFGKLVPLERAYGTRAVVLADGPLGKFSTFDPYAVELSGCPQSAFSKLLEWSACPHIARAYLARSQREVASNEIELASRKPPCRLPNLIHPATS